MPMSTAILGAFKVTGKTRHGLSLGVLDSLTARTRAAVSFDGRGRDETVEPLTNYFMLRAQQDFNEGKTIIGAMVTAVNRDINDEALDFLHRSAYTGGIDFFHTWKNSSYYVSANSVFSLVQGSREAILRTQESSVHYFQRPDADYLDLDPGRTSLGGYGGNVEIGKRGSGKLRYAGGVTWRSPGLELNDMGYLHQADVIMAWGWAGYRIMQPTWVFNQLNLNVNAWKGYNFGGTPIFVGGNVNFWGQLKNYWSVNVGINRQGTGLSQGALRGGPYLRSSAGWNTWLGVGSDARKRFTRRGERLAGTGADDRSRRATGTPSWPWSTAPATGCRSRSRPDTAITTTTCNTWTPSRRRGERQPLRHGPHRAEHGLRDPAPELQRHARALHPVLRPALHLQRPLRRLQAHHAIPAPPSSATASRPTAATRSRSTPAATNTGSGKPPAAPPTRFANPDFNVLELRTNLVLRWEYRPGAALYVVWSQGRGDDSGRDDFELASGFRDLMNLPGHPRLPGEVHVQFQSIEGLGSRV